MDKLISIMTEHFLASVIITLIVWGVISIVIAFWSLDLQERKGYTNGLFINAFLATFFFGLAHLIYSAGLPLAQNDSTLTSEDKKILKERSSKALKDSLTAKEDVDYIYCKRCGFIVFNNEKKCSNCNYPKDGFEKKETSSKSNKKD